MSNDELPLPERELEKGGGSETGRRPASMAAADRERAFNRRTGPILVAIDGGPQSPAVIAAARVLAARLSTPVEVFAVVDYAPVIYGVSIGMEPLIPELEADRRRELLDAVRDRLREAGGESEQWPVEIGQGSPASAIVERARERRARLIVMGLGHHAVVERVLGGETTLATVRRADRPVLAVPDRFGTLPQRAVVAVDFSPASVWAIETALHLLSDGATLTLVHVGPLLPQQLAGWSKWKSEYEGRLADQYARLTAHLHTYLEEEPLTARDVRIETETVTGVPAREITAFAERSGADLLALGTSGHGFVERLVVGSVATGVLRRATCAVLVAPRPPAAEADRIARQLTGSVEHTDPAEWPDMLDEFTRRNTGRRTELEVDDPDVGAYSQERGYALIGATYDRHDRRVELMLGDPTNRRRHLTRGIEGSSSISVTCDASGRDAALRIRHGRGQTLLRFLPEPNAA